MPRFTAQVWVSGEIPYDTETNASSVFQARTIIARREGVDEKYVNRIFEVRESNSSSSSSSSSNSSSISNEDATGFVIIAGLLFGIWFIVKYWWIVLPVVAILGYLVYLGSKD